MSFDPSISKFLQNHVLFRDYADGDFISNLASAMKTRVFADGAFVCRKGEVGRAMFFVLRGTIDVISEDGETILNKMNEGSFFGEIGVLFSVPRTATCRSHGRSILLVLTKEALQKVLEPYPSIARGITIIAEERYAAHMKEKNNSLNVEFAEELTLGVTHKDLHSVPLFRDCEVGFLHNLALTLTPMQYNLGQYIFRKGDMSSDMYFVVKGKVEVFNEETQAIYATFHSGAFFGEVGLLFNSERSASVRAADVNVTLFKLARSDLDELLKEYPEVKQKVQKEAEQRRQYIQARHAAKLSDNLQRETDVEVFREKLKTVGIFRGASDGFLHRLVLVAQVKRFRSGEVIIKHNEIGYVMYFIVDGTVAVVSDDLSTAFAKLDAGAYFGEVSLFFEKKRTASIIASTDALLLEISREQVMELLDSYPELKEGIWEKARENYRLFRDREKEVSQINKEDLNLGVYGIEATTMRIKQVRMFQRCDDGFIRELAFSTHIQQYKEGQIVVQKGDDSKEMYFIVSGTLEVVSDTVPAEVYDVLREGSFFGEVGVIRSVPRIASVRVSSETCDLITLTKEGLNRCIRNYPEYFHSITIEAENRLKMAEARRGSQSSIHQSQTLASPSTETENDSEPAPEFAQNLAQKTLGGSHFVPAPLYESDQSQDSLADVPAKAHRRSSLASVSSSAHSQSDRPKQESHLQKKISKMFTSFKSSLHSRHHTKVVPAETSTVITDPENKGTSASQDHSTVSPAPTSRSVQHLLDADEYQLKVILSCVPPRSLWMLRRVCKKWRDILSLPIFWSRVNLSSDFRIVHSKSIDIILLLASHNLTRLNLNGCWRVQDSDLKKISAVCPQLKQLSISNCWKISDKGLETIAKNVQGLQSLDISYCGHINGTAFEGHVWRSIKEVNISYCKQINDARLEKLVERAGDIQAFRMRRCSRLTDFGVFLIVRHCRKIRSLDMSDCDQVTDRCLKWIAASCTQLTDLRARFCQKLSNSGMYDLSLGPQRFKHLSFAHCELLTDASMIYFSSNIASLQSLNLRSCTKMTDQSVSYLCGAIHSLYYVNVSACPHISQTSKTLFETTFPKIRIMADKSPEERHVIQPGTFGKPQATEVPLRVYFTWGPKHIMNPDSSASFQSGHSNRSGSVHSGGKKSAMSIKKKRGMNLNALMSSGSTIE